MKLLPIAVAIACAVSVCCKQKPAKNTVRLEQIRIDNSNDYRYIFRDEIEREKWRDKRYDKGPAAQ